MTNNENYESIKNNVLSNYNNKLAKLKELLLNQKSNTDIRKIEFYEKRIQRLLGTINDCKNVLNCMRPHTETDLINRNKILNCFPNEVDQVIPDNIPLVFHGNRNIETVKQIISSGGLFTPEQRGVDFTSFATQIDVTYKSNIRVSCEFADGNINSFMPYGAIFVLLPKEEEYDKVLNTGESSEVSGGIDGVNFKEEPQRLVSIITTEENLNALKDKCKENIIDPSKVYTHEQFINMCKNVYYEEAIRKGK